MTHSEEQDVEKVKKVARATIDYLIKNPHTKKSKITTIKAKFAKKYSYNGVIKNATILDMATEHEKKVITSFFPT